MKNMSLMVLVGVMLLTGCSFFYDLYPAKLSKDAIKYVNSDPNFSGWPSIGKSKELKSSVETKHTLTQTELSALISRDNTLFARASEQTTINLAAAETERAKLIGTMEQPGYLLGVLLPLMGGIAGNFITKLTHYSEQELQTEINKVKNGSNPESKPTTA